MGCPHDMTDMHIEPLNTWTYREPWYIPKLIIGNRLFLAYGDMTLAVPAGLEIDGASIPRLLWRVIGPPLYGRYRPAAVIHDACYGGHLCVSIHGKAINDKPDRAQSDDMLYHISRYNGVSRLHARTMWRAVRLFGQAAWDKGHAA